jgi:hypothetical protein
MANWYGLGRTNYFHVKDRAAFDNEIKLYGLEDIVIEGKNGSVALSGYGYTDDGDLPSLVENPDNDTEIEFWDFIRPHLADNEVLIYMAAGNEKARYASGYALAMKSEGDMVSISIDDIYILAEREFGVRPSRAEY